MDIKGVFFSCNVCVEEGARAERQRSYSDIVAPQLHVGDGVPVAGVAAGEAAVLTHGRLLGLAVVQPVLVVLETRPGLGRLRLHQQVPEGRARLLQVRLDVGLAARGVAAQADFDGGQRRATAAQDALQRRRAGLLHAQGVVLLNYIGQFVVLLQAGLLRVRVITLGAASQRRVFGPGLADAAPAEVVLAGQLDGIREHVQADGADELLLETVPPRLRHVRGHHGAAGHRRFPTPSGPRGHRFLQQKKSREKVFKSQKGPKVCRLEGFGPDQRLPDGPVLLIAAAGSRTRTR